MSTERDAVRPITRPNGSIYRPRKLALRTLGTEDEYTGLVVFGTHDVNLARQLADARAAHLSEDYMPGDGLEVRGEGERVWWSEKLSHFLDGQPWYTYEPDVEHGRAGVEFELRFFEGIDR